MMHNEEFDMGKELQTSLLTVHRPSVIHQYPSSAPGRHESISENILEPIRQKLAQSLQPFISASTHPDVLLLASSVRDLQVVLSLELLRISSFGTLLSKQKLTGLTRSDIHFRYVLMHLLHVFPTYLLAHLVDAIPTYLCT